MKSPLSAVLAAHLLLCAQMALAEAGRFQFVAGEVRIVQADGRARAAQKGQAVDEGDSVVTGTNGTAQLLMADEGVIAVRPDSTLKVELYRFQGREDGTERSILSLIKGGFRTLTGIIGRANKRNYLVRTPTATIGIRGTDHEPVYIPPEGWPSAPDGAPGTYNLVNAGETYIETEGGRIELSANQVGFAPPDPKAPPTRLRTIPGFLRATPAPQGRAEGRGLREQAPADVRREIAEARRTDDKRFLGAIALTILQRDDRPLQAPVSADGTFDFNRILDNLHPAPEGVAIAGGDKSGEILGSGAGVVGPGDMKVMLDAAGHPVLISDTTTGFRYARSGAPVIHAGGTTIIDPNDGSPVAVDVRWGIYAGGTIIDSMGTRAVDYFHFMGAPGTPPAVAAGLTGTYTFEAGGNVVTELGVGTPAYNAAQTKVTLAMEGKITGYQVSLSDDGFGRTWQATCVSCANGIPVKDFAKNNIPLVGVSSSGGVAGHASGYPIGPTGQGIISSFDLHSIDGKGVTGSFVGRK